MRGGQYDTFYVVGNAVVAAAVPCLFGMADTITDERYTHTLSLLVVSPASRLALFLGRAAPVALNGAIVAAFAFAVGALLLDVSVPAEALGGLVLTILVTAFACTGLGIVNASLGLRWRETAVLSKMILYFLLLAAGVNVPLDLLPGWLSTVAQVLPVTHGVEAARELVQASPSSLVAVLPLLGAELLVGVVYATIGLSSCGSSNSRDGEARRSSWRERRARRRRRPAQRGARGSTVSRRGRHDGGDVALAGGSTPRHAYELAAALQPDWSRVDVWLGDERCVPPDDEHANVRLVREAARRRLEVHRASIPSGPSCAPADAAATTRRRCGA